MKSNAIFERVASIGVVPVVAIDSVDYAIPLADALMEGGLPVAEVTFRTKAAASAMERMIARQPGLIVGAGTVLTEENLKAAIACGAKFGVAPGLNPDIVISATEKGFPFIPGIATPSEIEQGLALGCKLLKFFPAEPSGGTKMISALFAPYSHMGVKFMPTGGVAETNLEAYLATPGVCVVGGTWIAKKDDMASGRWNEIKKRCAVAAEIAKRVKSSQ